MAYLLIIDDDEDFAGAAATALRSDEHEVQVELEIESAVASMEQRAPDLVILDVMFPEDSSAGFKLARTMQHLSKKLKRIPILMLTAINAKFPMGFSSQDIDDNWLPVEDFLEKPVDLNVLREKISALLQKAGADSKSTG